MSFLQILILSIIQGAAELLPVSSSAHVIVAERFMGIDPSSPEMTFFLVMLHTGTMFAVLLYFWRRWKNWFLGPQRWEYLKFVVIATIMTGVIGFILKFTIEKIFYRTQIHYEIEDLFRNLPLIGTALFSAGLLIIWSGRKDDARPLSNSSQNLSTNSSIWIGAVQGLCLPFRGFSRSGSTISTALLLGISRRFAEEFSFILAVVLTPPVVLRELLRLRKYQIAMTGDSGLLDSHSILQGVFGMGLSFLAGLLALRWLSAWLERGKWRFFGYYCLLASVVVFLLSLQPPA